MKATHYVWDDSVDCDVPVCDEHAAMIIDGRGGQRFWGSKPIPMTDVQRAWGVQCAFSCHELGCHGYFGRTDADLERVGLS